MPLEKVKSDFHLVEKEFTLLNGDTPTSWARARWWYTIWPIFDDFDRAKSTSLKKINNLPALWSIKISQCVMRCLD